MNKCLLPFCFIEELRVYYVFFLFLHSSFRVLDLNHWLHIPLVFIKSSVHDSIDFHIIISLVFFFYLISTFLIYFSCSYTILILKSSYLPFQNYFWGLIWIIYILFWCFYLIYHIYLKIIYLMDCQLMQYIKNNFHSE